MLESTARYRLPLDPAIERELHNALEYAGGIKIILWRHPYTTPGHTLNGATTWVDELELQMSEASHVSLGMMHDVMRALKMDPLRDVEHVISSRNVYGSQVQFWGYNIKRRGVRWTLVDVPSRADAREWSPDVYDSDV